jgi:uncharacterized protein
VNPRDWLMLFIAFEGAPNGLDPVRLQKGMFLFERETDVPPQEKYRFRAYNYGPMSKAIYDDLDGLVAHGLVEKVPVEGQSWGRYRPTKVGIEQGAALLDAALAQHPDATQHLFRTKAAVADVSFDDLLTDVYERYPEYAEKSIFRRRS